MQVKAQKLKNTRDYSFLLSDDKELPTPSKAPPPQNMHIRNSGILPSWLYVYMVLIVGLKHVIVIKETYTGFLLMLKRDDQLKFQQGVKCL